MATPTATIALGRREKPGIDDADSRVRRTVKPYLDPSMSEQQMGAIGQILGGQAGGAWFEVLASIVTEVKDPPIVPIDFRVEGRHGTIKVGDAMENRFAPIKNPITGDDETVRVAIPGGAGVLAGGWSRRDPGIGNAALDR